MKDFMQWLSERGIRTAINGIYPPAYNGVHGMTPNAMTAVTATAPVALKNTGKEKGKCDELSPEMRKEAGCKGKAKKEKNPWEDSFSKTESDHSFTEGKKGKKAQPVVMKKKDDGPQTIDAGVGRTHNTHLAAFRTGAHKNKKAFNKSDRNKSKSQVKSYYEVADPMNLWNTFLDTPQGEKYKRTSLEQIMGNWRLKAQVNSDIHEALGERGRELINFLSSSTAGAEVDDHPWNQGETRPSGDVYKQTQASRDMMERPWWHR